MKLKMRVVIVAILLPFTRCDGNASNSQRDSPGSRCLEEKVFTLSEANLNSTDPTSVEVSVGQGLNITMQSLPGHPLCNWTFGANPISEGYSMTIAHTSEEDSGEYTFTCVRWDGSISSLTINLTVGSTLRSPSRPQLVIVTKQTEVPDFECSSEGSPKPIIKWYNQLYRSGSGEDVNRMAESGGSGKVRSLQSSQHYDSNTVMCCAKNSEGVECSHLYNYDLGRGVSMDDEAPEITLSPGQTLLLRCKAEQNYQAKWKTDNMKLVNTLEVVFGGLSMDYLYILSVTVNHSGLYTCFRSDNNNAKSTQIRVLEKGFISVSHLSESYTISAQKNKEFCLRPEVSSHPPLRCCYLLGPDNSVTRCPEPKRSWMNRTLELCNPVLGKYELHLETEDQTLTESTSVCVSDTPMVHVSLDGDKITCNATTTLPFNLTWWSCSLSSCLQTPDADVWSVYPSHPPEVKNSDKFCHKDVHSYLHKDLLKEHAFKCCVVNSFHSHCTETIFHAEPLTSPPPPSFSNSVLLQGSLVVGLALIVIFVCVRKKKPQYQSQLQMIQMTGPNDNDYIYINFKDFEYDQKWEFPRENLELGRELGSGAFGMVVQATAYDINKPGVSQQVAVKMLKEKHETVEKEALFSELKMLTHIGQHANIVNLLGACTNSGPTYLIFQYCSEGDLLNYLKNKRELYQKSLTEAASGYRFSCLYNNLPRRHSSGLQKPEDKSLYISMSPIHNTVQEDAALLSLNSSCMDTYDSQSQGISEDLKEQTEEEDSEQQVLTYDDLLSFSYQVAKGMDFLSSMQCIHRDLAARNVLVTKGGQVKIGDFGLARDIENDSNYVVKGNVRLPVKWMAPESIFQGIYTMQSDVWAYGILLWEIFSLGVTPYPGIKVDKDFYMKIERGYQMGQPYYASESVYKIMCECWAMQPRDRPQFPKLVAFMVNELTCMEEKLYCNILDKSSNDLLYQNAPGNCDLSALAKEKEGLQIQNQYCKTHSTGEAPGTTAPSDTAVMETDGDEKPLKQCQ